MRVLHRLVFVAAALAGAAGCKQAIGDRCQIDDDCSSGHCSSAKVCATSTTTTPVDAPPPSDARVDAPPIVFPADAPIVLPPDASPIDAGAGDAP